MINNQQLKLIAHLLKNAAECANARTNDFNLTVFIPDLDARRELVRDYEIWNSGGVDFDPKALYTSFPSWALLPYFAAKIDAYVAASRVIANECVECGRGGGLAPNHTMSCKHAPWNSGGVS